MIQFFQYDKKIIWGVVMAVIVISIGVYYSMIIIFTACCMDIRATENNIVSTSNWKTYVDNVNGYQISYPANWTARNHDTLAIFYSPESEKTYNNSRRGSEGDIKIDICENINTDCARNGSWIGMRNYKDIPDLLSDKDSHKKLEKVLPFNFIENTGQNYGVLVSGEGVYYEVMFQKGEKIFNISFPSLYSSSDLSTEQKQILSTFKFTSSTTINQTK